MKKEYKTRFEFLRSLTKEEAIEAFNNGEINGGEYLSLPRPQSDYETRIKALCAFRPKEGTSPIDKIGGVTNIKAMENKEDKLKQIFENFSDCYADTGRFENDGSYTEGEVILAMTKDAYIKALKEVDKLIERSKE